MDFGVPNLKKTKKEKYEHLGVITLEPTGDGLARRMVFNIKSTELLGISNKDIDNQIAFSFSNGEIFIANMNGLEGHSEVKVGKNNAVSNKKYYDYIKKQLNKTDIEEIELFLIETENEYNGNKVYTLSLIQPEEVIVNVDMDTVAVSEYDENEDQDTSFLSPQPEQDPVEMNTNLSE